MTDCLSRPCRIGDALFSLREVGAGETAAVLALFARVFGYAPPPGWYEWKYGASGLQGRAMGLWAEDGRLVAHYAGFPRSVLWQGRSIEAIQIGDVMVAPELRGILSRRGPFFQVCDAFFGKWVGSGRPFSLAFGFPNARAMRLGVALGLYRDLGPIHRLVWPAGRLRLPLGWRVTEIEPGCATFTRLAEFAWQRMAKERRLEVIGLRDAAHWRTRFAARPATPYLFLALRRPFGSPALVILRQEGEIVRWLDFAGPRAALPAAVAAARRFAAAAGASRVEAWASRAAFDELTGCEAQEAGPAAHYAVALASSCPIDTLAQSGWWLAGDTDFL